MPTGITLPGANAQEDQKSWRNYSRPGDIHNSACHDLCWFIVGWVIFIGVVACVAYGLAQDRLWAVTYPWDPTGNYCGRNNEEINGSLLVKVTTNQSFTLEDYSSRPFLFFGAGRSVDGVRYVPGEEQICVEKCPDFSLPPDDVGPLVDAIADRCANDARVLPGGPCGYPTKVIQRRCIPDLPLSLLKNEELKNNVTKLIDVIGDVIRAVPGIGPSLLRIQTYWRQILVAALCSVVVCALWIVLLRFIAGCLVYTVLICVPVLLVLLGIWVFVWGENALEFDNPNGAKYVAAGIWVVALIMVLLLVFLWKRVKMAVTVIEVGSEALFANFGSLATPLVAIVLLVCFWSLAIAGCLSVLSIHKFMIADRNEWVGPFHRHGPALLFSDEDKQVQYLLIFLVVFIIYISVHVYFQSYYAQSASLVNWYFDPEKTRSCCGCLYGYWLAWTKSLGTITLSALLMTPLYILIAFCEYLDYKRQQNPDQVSQVTKFLLKCLRCCLWCFEKFLRWINKNLLTVSQIYNRSWWAAMMVTVDILTGDVILTALYNGIVMFVMFMSKVIVALITAALFMAYIRWGTTEEETNWLLPACCVFVLAYIIASVFLSLFESVMDVIFVCHQADCDLTSNGTIRPMYCSSDQELATWVNDVRDASVSAAGIDGARGSYRPDRT